MKGENEVSAQFNAVAAAAYDDDDNILHNEAEHLWFIRGPK